MFIKVVSAGTLRREVLIAIDDISSIEEYGDNCLITFKSNRNSLEIDSSINQLIQVLC